MAEEEALALLKACGAEAMDHPGGTLPAHLLRVRERLAAWGAREELCLAGLCHAFYGTDGFPTALLPLDRRAELRTAVGTEAEHLVYAYAACDRDATYPTLERPDGPYRDRFTGTVHIPSDRQRRDLAELTAANELDIASVSPDFRHRWGPGLLTLFQRLRPLLSPAAWEDAQHVLLLPDA
ncbi:DUF6817 domain-containing protein [Streptomyces sp. TRM64462]|uniref:DUF6817 domain-containing protein n=1 Tax=Streptomyces sp. TRM64462 TaxID=2741726 RepID=UPI0015866596|nr:hypothetical protein [Streptomyces sp. TRM64462]